MRWGFPRDAALAAVAAVLLLAGGLTWLARERVRVVPPARPTPIMPADIQMRLGKVRLHGVSKGKLIWEVEAENFDLLKDRPLLRISGLKKAVILNGTTSELTLTADALERNTLTGEMTVQGQVTVTGKSLLLRTPYASWDPAREVLLFPGRFSAQFGDFTLSSMGATQYDVKANLLVSRGGVLLAMPGGTIRAGSINVNLATHAYTLDDGVVAEFNVGALTAWMAGQALPTIPEIPAGIKARYREYLAKMGRGPTAKGG